MEFLISTMFSKKLNQSAGKSVWPEVTGWLKACEAALPAVWPPELPPEQTPDFWFVVCRHEMASRKDISAQLRSMIITGDTGMVQPLQAWLIRRRFEWAGQLAMVAVMKKNEPDEGLAEILEWVLIVSWETDGCISMWNHAERGGTPHPENADGLSPLPSE